MYDPVQIVMVAVAITVIIFIGLSLIKNKDW